ncbi:Ig-like domain-containing protein [Exiguobacterium aurantiacum]|uniref:Ig-like domain-containing protein n=1 Tax=Exiguobacterium aurantiacum TaxID=33987 RepID=A0ABY5FPX2_9BACL|nr:Ig-like domain-containing protein [Exiguobacterium aurantiacum]UTT43478.1 Ig-like domain-containing protein [Exiguobacterium aurantiacum]
MDETLVDSHIFKGYTLPGITIGLYDVNHQEPFITTEADENGFFYLDVGENRMLDGFNVISGTYTFTFQSYYFPNHEQRSFLSPRNTEGVPNTYVSPFKVGDSSINGWVPPNNKVTYISKPSGRFGSCPILNDGILRCSYHLEAETKAIEITVTPPKGEPSTILVDVERSSLQLSPTSLYDEYIRGKSTPYDVIRINSSHSLNLVQRADENGDFKIRIPKAQYGDYFKVYSEAMSYSNAVDVMITDTRKLEKPTYVIKNNELKVLLKHFKTTKPFAKLVIEKSNGTFQSYAPKNEKISDQVYQFSFTDIKINNEDTFKVTISDEVVTSTFVEDTITGRNVIINRLTDADTKITGTTSPYTLVTTDVSSTSALSDATGKFELPLNSSNELPNQLITMNEKKTQTYTTPLLFEDVTAPSVRSHDYMTDTLFLTFNEKDVSIQLKTYDALGKVIQTEEAHTDSTEHIFHMLNHPNEINKVELVLTDSKGHISKPIVLNIPKAENSLSIGNVTEGAPYVLISNGRIGDTIVVEHKGKIYEHRNTEWTETSHIRIPNLEAGDQLTAFIKGNLDKVTTQVGSSKVRQSISPDRKRVSFVYYPGKYEEIYYQWILIDENQNAFPMTEEQTKGDTNTVLYFPTSLPKNHSVRLIIKSKNGQIFYDLTKQFYSPDMPANPMNISWTDQTTHLELNIGSMSKVEAWYKGQKQFTTEANYEGKVSHTLPTSLKAGDVWTFVIRTALGISYSHEVVVKDATPPKLLSLAIPRTAQADYTGIVEPGTNVYISTPNGDKLYKADAKGNFVIPAKDYDFNQEFLSMMLRDDSKIETQIQVPRKLATEPVIAGSTVLRGQTMRHAVVIARINGSDYSATTSYDGNFKIAVPTGVPHTKIKWTVAVGDQIYEFPEENVLGKLAKFITEPFLPTHSFIKGKMTAGTRIEATVAGKIIGTSVASNDGTFSIQVPRQVAGTVVTLHGHRLGYQSETTNVLTLNLFPTWSLGAIDSADTYISGKGLVGSYAQAYANDRAISSKVKIGSSGTFKLTIPKQKGGTYITVKLEHSGYASSEKKTKVLFNFTGHTVNSVTRKMTTLTGKGTSGSVMTAYVGSRKIGTSVKVSSKGTYQIRVPLQKAGTKITVKQTKSGYVTSAKTTTVLNVFSKLTVNPVTRSHTYMSGTADKTATVQAYVGSKAISKKATVNSKGQYRLTIPKQKTGTTVKVVLQKSGYQSMSKTIKVK